MNVGRKIMFGLHNLQRSIADPIVILFSGILMIFPDFKYVSR